MFEGKLPEPSLFDRRADESEDEPLKNLSWSDLAARLTAARDLRREMEKSLTDGGCSFDPASARKLSAREGEKPTINSIGLASGKATDGIDSEHASDHTDGD